MSAWLWKWSSDFTCLKKEWPHPYPKLSRGQLEKHAANMFKQAGVMDYIKQHNVELSEKVKSLAKSYKLSREHDREIEF